MRRRRDKEPRHKFTATQGGAELILVGYGRHSYLSVRLLSEAPIHLRALALAILREVPAPKKRPRGAR